MSTGTNTAEALGSSIAILSHCTLEKQILLNKWGTFFDLNLPLFLSLTALQLILLSRGSCRPSKGSRRPCANVFRYIELNTYMSSIGSASCLCQVIDSRPISYLEHCSHPYHGTKPRAPHTIPQGVPKNPENQSN